MDVVAPPLPPEEETRIYRFELVCRHFQLPIDYLDCQLKWQMLECVGIE